MSSGGKKTTTTVNSSAPPAWSEPYFKNLLNQAGTLVNTPYQGYAGPTVAGFTPDQLAAFDAVNGMQNGNAAQLASASEYAQSVAGGGVSNPWSNVGNAYAGDNPHLQGVIDAANRDITRSYSDVTLPTQLAQFNAGGAYGGSAMQQALTAGQRNLAEQLSDTTTAFRSADYDRQAQLAESALNRNAGLWQQDQQNRMNASALIPSLQQAGYANADQLFRQGALQQSFLQQVIDDDREQFNEARGWKANQLGLLANALGTIQGGTSTSTGANPNYKSATENAVGYGALLASYFA